MPKMIEVFPAKKIDLESVLDEDSRKIPDIDDIPLTFGKHEGLTPNQIANEDTQYIIWMYEHVKPRRCSCELYNACQEDEALDIDAIHDLYDDIVLHK